MNAVSVLFETVDKYPEKSAIIFEGLERSSKMSYREVGEKVDKLAEALFDLGLQTGDVVSIDLPSTDELAISYFAVMKAGMVANVINVMLKGEEVKYILNDASASLLITNSKNMEMVGNIAPEVSSLEKVITVDGGGDLSFKQIFENYGGSIEMVDCNRDDLTNLLYTSGTTGFPKGVMLTHMNIWDNAVNFAKIHYTEDDILMVAAPLFHCWGLINGVMSIFYAGGTALIEERFKAEKILQDIEKYRPTIMQGVPTMYNMMLGSPSIQERDISSLKFVLSAAAPMPVKIIKGLKEKSIGYAEAYGLTEVSPVITTAPQNETRFGSCGYAMGDAEFKVVDEKGNVLPPGSAGELCCRGTAVMKGYMNKPEATREVIEPEGWFHTGDVVEMDEEGYVYIVDRKKDMVNVGGEKVYPREVEEVLFKHPKVKDAAVVGVRDEVYGEIVKAFVVPKEGSNLKEEEVKSYCKEKCAIYKVPKLIEFVDEIPRSAAGKTLRKVLRDNP